MSCLKTGHVSGPQPVNFSSTKKKEKLDQQRDGKTSLSNRKCHARHSLDELPRDRRGAARLVNFNPVGVRLRGGVESRPQSGEKTFECRNSGTCITR